MQIGNLCCRKATMHFSPLAYLDPGSGSFLIQILIAVLIGVGVAVRASWGKIKNLFGKGQADTQIDDDADTNE
jgi:hypothetical protein